MDLIDEPSGNSQLDINIIRATLAQNDYVFLRPIGKGGFSSVFLIYSNQYNLEFVLKVSNNYQKSRKFDINEINNLINLDHPNIIRMYKYFTDDRYLYIVLEYCEGGSIKDLIKQKGRIRSPALFNYCQQVLTALKHCHDLQISHNDLKPANILIDKNKRLKLADFGLSKGFSSNLIQKVSDNSIEDEEVFFGKNGEILTKHFGGSKAYMAPELFKPDAYDPFKADIWALGVTFYEMATGHLPWKTGDMKELRLSISIGVISFQNVKLPSAFCNLVHRMIEVNPSKRASLDWLLDQEIFSQQYLMNHSRPMINKSPSVGSKLGSLTSAIYKFKNRPIKLSSNFQNKSSYFLNINDSIVNQNTFSCGTGAESLSSDSENAGLNNNSDNNNIGNLNPIPRPRNDANINGIRDNNLSYLDNSQQSITLNSIANQRRNNRRINSSASSFVLPKTFM